MLSAQPGTDVCAMQDPGVRRLGIPPYAYSNEALRGAGGGGYRCVVAGPRPTNIDSDSNTECKRRAYRWWQPLASLWSV